MSRASDIWHGCAPALIALLALAAVVAFTIGVFTL